jgi:hypothetical protein
MAEVIRGALKRPAKAALEAAIRAEAGNLTKTAARLHATRQTLYTWIYQLGLERLAGVRPAAEILKPPVPTNGAGPARSRSRSRPSLLAGSKSGRSRLTRRRAGS